MPIGSEASAAFCAQLGMGEARAIPWSRRQSRTKGKPAAQQVVGTPGSVVWEHL